MAVFTTIAHGISMITNYDIKKIIQDCNGNGHDVKVRDIAYVILCSYFEDATVASKAIYGDESGKDIEAIPHLTKYMEQHYLKKKKSGSSPDDELSFEENKAEMIKLINETKLAMDRDEVPKKDGLKILADLRVKLNDKFNVQDESKDSLVVVESKYNSVCEYCGHEIAVPTKEQLMSKYNLIEKK